MGVGREGDEGVHEVGDVLGVEGWADGEGSENVAGDMDLTGAGQGISGVAGEIEKFQGPVEGFDGFAAVVCEFGSTVEFISHHEELLFGREGFKSLLKIFMVDRHIGIRGFRRWKEEGFRRCVSSGTVFEDPGLPLKNFPGKGEY